ncbi:L-selectin-like [Amphiura filiformis]|uniref:L-selectin-like n=1 Tax=Amphiura filiformis TaxID=82378 RepID=UPI003B2117FF
MFLEGRPPISCDPDCGDNGECAEGNNCVCETGYTGYRCQTQIRCSSLPLTDDNVVHLQPPQNNYDVGSQVSFSCRAGYRLVGISTLTCSHIPPNVVSTWSSQPPICIEEDNIIRLIGIILGGIALLGVLVGLPLVAFLCCRHVITPPKGQLETQQPLQLVPYDGVNQYQFTGNAQMVPDPLMF